MNVWSVGNIKCVNIPEYLPVGEGCQRRGGVLPLKREARLTQRGLLTKSARVLQWYLKQTRIFCILWIRCVFVNIVFIFIFLFVVSLVLWYILVHTCIYSSLWTIWIIGTVNKLHSARKCCASEPSFLVLSRTHIPFFPSPWSESWYLLHHTHH